MSQERLTLPVGRMEDNGSGTPFRGTLGICERQQGDEFIHSPTKTPIQIKKKIWPACLFPSVIVPELLPANSGTAVMTSPFRWSETMLSTSGQADVWEWDGAKGLFGAVWAGRGCPPVQVGPLHADRCNSTSVHFGCRGHSRLTAAALVGGVMKPSSRRVRVGKVPGETLGLLSSAWRWALRPVCAYRVFHVMLFDTIGVFDRQVPWLLQGLGLWTTAGLRGSHQLTAPGPAATQGPRLWALCGGQGVCSHRNPWPLQEAPGLPHQSLLHIREHIVSQHLVEVIHCVLPFVVLPKKGVLPVPQLRLLDFKPLHPSIPNVSHNLLQGFNHGFLRQVPDGRPLLWSLGLTWHAEQSVAVPEGSFQRWLGMLQIQILWSLRETLWIGFLSAGVDRMILSVQGSQQGCRVQTILCRGFSYARSIRMRRSRQGEGFHPSVVQGALTSREVEGKLSPSLVEVLLSFLIPTTKRGSVNIQNSVERENTGSCKKGLKGS